MANKTCTVDGGDWEDTATWGGAGAPGVNDKAIIPDATHVPLAPVGATTIHDFQATGVTTTMEYETHLTVSHTVVLSGSKLQLKAQTTAGQAVTLTGASILKAAGTVAGAVTLANTSSLASLGSTIYSGSVTSTVTGLNGDGDKTLAGGTYTGTVTANSSTQFDAITINGTLNLPSNAYVSQAGIPLITWGASATLHFTGAGDANFLGGTLAGTITADDVLLATPALANINLDGCDITTGASAAFVVPVASTSGFTGSYDGATIAGASAAGSFIMTIGFTGTPTITGYGSFYKVGAGGSVTSLEDRTKSVIVPAAENLRRGFQAGDPDHPIDGTMGPEAIPLPILRRGGKINRPKHQVFQVGMRRTSEPAARFSK